MSILSSARSSARTATYRAARVGVNVDPASAPRVRNRRNTLLTSSAAPVSFRDTIRVKAPSPLRPLRRSVRASDAFRRQSSKTHSAHASATRVFRDGSWSCSRCVACFARSFRATRRASAFSSRNRAPTCASERASPNRPWVRNAFVDAAKNATTRSTLSIRAARFNTPPGSIRVLNARAFRTARNARAASQTTTPITTCAGATRARHSKKRACAARSDSGKIVSRGKNKSYRGERKTPRAFRRAAFLDHLVEAQRERERQKNERANQYREDDIAACMRHRLYRLYRRRRFWLRLRRLRLWLAARARAPAPRLRARGPPMDPPPRVGTAPSRVVWASAHPPARASAEARRRAQTRGAR